MEGNFNPKHRYLAEWARQFEHLPRTPSPNFKSSVWERVLKRCKSWKAPGKDGIHGFWYKAFPQMKMILGQALWEALIHPKKIKPWLVHGRTVLIPKEGCDGSPHQFRPTTCLNVMYKLLTAIVTEMLYNHAIAIGAIPQEQQALIRKKRGCTDALLISHNWPKNKEHHCRLHGWITKRYSTECRTNGLMLFWDPSKPQR